MIIPSRAFVLARTVEPADIDPQNHASNVAIVGWMNDAAWRHSVAMGFDGPRYRALGGLWVVKRHEIDYHAQAMLGDELLCYTWPSALHKASAQRLHRIVRPADNTVIADGLNTWAWIDAATHRPGRIGPELRQAFDPALFT
jgi:acyl-CoA thioester hydrolase